MKRKPVHEAMIGEGFSPGIQSCLLQAGASGLFTPRYAE